MRSDRTQRAADWLARRHLSFWALVALSGVIFVAAWTLSLNRSTDATARRTEDLAIANRKTIADLRQTNARLRRAVEYQCATNAALDLVVREFIAAGARRLASHDLDRLSALQTLHLFLADTTACREVTG